MAMETLAILKSLYRDALTANSVEDVQKAILVMLDEEQAAHVEKIVAGEKIK